MAELHGFLQGELFLDNISSFWSKVFKDSDVAQALVSGTEETLSQAYFNLLEVILANSVHDIPVFHREKWQLLVFNESDKNRNAESLLKYGQGAVYGPQTSDSEFPPGQTFQYGGFASGKACSFKLPDQMVDVESYLVNRIHEPSLVLTKGVDFYINNGVIFFKENPFENELIATRAIQDEDGNTVDRQIGIWALNSDHDFQFLFKNYGALIDIFLESSENYKQFLRSAWELFFVGPRITSLLSTLNSLLGLPTIRDAKETFQTTLLEGNTQKVVTDKNVYSLPVSTPLRSDLETGLELEVGDPIAGVITILDDVSTPSWWRNFEFLPIPVRILTEDHGDDLIVFNISRKVPLETGATISLDVSGEMTEERRTFFEEFPLPIGGGWSIGDTSFSYRSLDLLFEFFFKAHLFLLTVNLDEILPSRLTSKVVELLKEALPAYVHFLSVNDVSLSEAYNLGTDSEEPEWEFERAHYYTDTYSDFSDGYHSRGPWLIGFDGIVISDPPAVEIGGTGLQPGMRWYIRRKPCI